MENQNSGVSRIAGVEAKKPIIDVRSITSEEIKARMDKEIPAEIRKEVYEDLKVRTQKRIVELYHQNIAFEKIKLEQKHMQLGRLELEQIGAKLNDNTAAVFDCYEDIVILDELINELSK